MIPKAKSGSGDKDKIKKRFLSVINYRRGGYYMPRRSFISKRASTSVSTTISATSRYSEGLLMRSNGTVDDSGYL